ncbi:DNA polymerase [uncultured phage cr107_1]|uniref:DNA polymerase n=1 Tax=uncultured phage cr107_1 TaxID=2772061 RepID=A0A7M1RV07_9CAUD|nr:DNA polymerase [uncultured phage cr107_1]QOR58243.1 DNA polymerase [uncultured phage cr107_1]
MSSMCYDVEVTRNYFSVVFVDLRSYLKIFSDCVDNDGKAIPLVDKLTIAEIKQRLETIPKKRFVLYEDDDTDLFSLLYWLQQKADYFGYNNRKYDRLMLSALLMYYNQFDKPSKLITFLYETSQRVIRSSNNDTLWTDNFTSLILRNNVAFRDLDLFQIFRLDHYHKSLKQTSINIKWYNLKEYTMPPIGDLDRHYYHERLPEAKGMTDRELNIHYRNVFERFIPKEYLNEMADYNDNDVYIVAELIRMNQEEVLLRYRISEEYKVDVYSASRSTIADKVIVKLYSKFTGLHPKAFIDTKTIRRKILVSEILSDKIAFSTPELNDILSGIRSLTLKGEKGEFDREFTFMGTSYTIATGGLHSNEIPAVYVENSDSIIVDRDVASYYPNMIRSLKVCQKHLIPKAWFRIADTIVDERLEHKHLAKDKSLDVMERDKHATAAACLKIVANAGIFGKMGSEKSFLCDKKAMYQVTINGQLFLLMLIEKLELAGIHVISANTDGIVTIVPRELEQTADDICHWWEKHLGLELEFTYYTKYVTEGVNSYLTVKRGGSSKFKGRMNPKMFLEDLSKGYNSPIVAKCVTEYFINGTPVMETLRNAKSILDFCRTQNVNHKYRLEFTHVVDGKIRTDVVQRNTRFYISSTGGTLMKVESMGWNEHNEEQVKKSSLCAGQRVSICNTVDDTDISELNVNYLYYYNEAMAIIEPIEQSRNNKGKGKRLVKKYYGMRNTLFD